MRAHADHIVLLLGSDAERADVNATQSVGSPWNMAPAVGGRPSLDNYLVACVASHCNASVDHTGLQNFGTRRIAERDREPVPRRGILAPGHRGGQYCTDKNHTLHGKISLV